MKRASFSESHYIGMMLFQLFSPGSETQNSVVLSLKESCGKLFPLGATGCDGIAHLTTFGKAGKHRVMFFNPG